LLPAAFVLVGSLVHAQTSQGAGSASCNDQPPTLDQASVRRHPVRPVSSDIVRGFLRGTVTLHLQIDQHGLLKEIKINKSSGYRELDQAAMSLAKLWRYSPAKRCGVSMDGVLDLPVKFALPESNASSK
jgi:protein TonB